MSRTRAVAVNRTPGSYSSSCVSLDSNKKQRARCYVFLLNPLVDPPDPRNRGLFGTTIFF